MEVFSTTRLIITCMHDLSFFVFLICPLSACMISLFLKYVFDMISIFYTSICFCFVTYMEMETLIKIYIHIIIYLERSTFLWQCICATSFY